MSIKFHWGHNHDFGDFYLPGRNGNRHIALLTALIDMLAVLPKDLTGKRVLDIGCWSGGTSLLLCAMGARVVAIEEVKKYIDCLNYLKYAFGLDQLDARSLSLYDLTSEEFHDGFDYILFGGVLYHLSDPIIGLRITFDCLKPGASVCSRPPSLIRAIMCCNMPAHPCMRRGVASRAKKRTVVAGTGLYPPCRPSGA